MIWLLALLLFSGEADPRISLVELQLQDRQDEALAAVSQHLQSDPERARELGLDYLRADLLERLGRPQEALDAFAAAMGATPTLAAYSRFRAARLQAHLAHPEVAGGLLATLLATNPPSPLIRPAAKLLAESLGKGADCRLIQGMASWRLPKDSLRILQVAAAGCSLKNGNTEDAVVRLSELLEAGVDDEPARMAAEELLRLKAGSTNRDASLLLGMVFHHQREFDLSRTMLQRGLSLAEEPSDDHFSLLYADARNDYWQGKYDRAALEFARIAETAQKAEEMAQARFQQARSLELLGDWNAARLAFGQAFNADPEGTRAASSLLSLLRLQWRLGYETDALLTLDRLREKRSWRGALDRALLFLASSDLVRGRSERATEWLAGIRGGGAEVDYWRGRTAELQERIPDAVRHYLDCLREDPSHPMALAARQRLGQTSLVPEVQAYGLRLARSSEADDLLDSWLLLGNGETVGSEIAQRLRESLLAQSRTVAYLEIGEVPPSAWPLWSARLRQPEELLLALGIWAEGAPVVLRHFPVAEASLGYTGSLLMAEGGTIRRSLYIGEILGERLLREAPLEFAPLEFRSILYPQPYQALVLRESARREIDPMLLAALIREESRYDPDAISAASARGLTQFVLPTSRRLAPAIGRSTISTQDLHRPEISIALGAAYLAELGHRFKGREEMVIAAYNAGEDLALLWRSYCYSSEPEEFFTKVGYRETRSYLAKVLRSRARYQAIYGNPRPEG